MPPTKRRKLVSREILISSDILPSQKSNGLQLKAPRTKKRPNYRDFNKNEPDRDDIPLKNGHPQLTDENVPEVSLLVPHTITNETKSRPTKETQKRKPRSTKPLLPLKCSECEYTSIRRYLLLRHTRCHSNERPYTCTICDQGFKSASCLSNHKRTHWGNKPFECNECESSYSTSGALSRHKRYKHIKEKPHKCTECDYASVELSKLRRHMTCHTGERPHQCPHCTYACSDTFKLKRHLRTHTGERPYTCHVCKRGFTQSNSLKMHLKQTHKLTEPENTCQICSISFIRTVDLRIHTQRMHADIEPMKCMYCEKNFTDKYSLRNHVKTHRGEKRYKCDKCPYAAQLKRVLNVHKLTHENKKPFQCETCKRSYKQTAPLRHHINKCHNPDYKSPSPMEKCYECNECGLLFARKGNLINHIQTHDAKAVNKKTELKHRKNINIVTNIKIENIKKRVDNEFTLDICLSPTMKISTDTINIEGEAITLPEKDSNQLVIPESSRKSDFDHQLTLIVPAHSLEETETQEDHIVPTNVNEIKTINEQGIPKMYNQELMKDVNTCFGFDEVNF